MSVGEFITRALTLFGGTAAVLVVLVAVAYWLSRRLLEHRLAKDLDRYKTELAIETGKQLETHKNTLARTQAEAVESLKREYAATLQAEKARLDHVVSRWSQRYSKFHEHRVNAIIELHVAIVDMRLALAPVFGFRPAGSRPVFEDAQIAGEKYNAAFRLFSYKRLFLDEELAARHEELLKTYLELITGFTHVPEAEMWRDAAGKWTKWSNQALGLERDIRREYQRSLGASEERVEFDAPSKS